jgi:hypothetical protein
MAQSIPHTPQALVLYLGALLLGGLFTTWDVIAFWILGLAFIVWLVVTTADLGLQHALWDRTQRGEAWPWVEAVREKYIMLLFIVISAAADVALYLATYAMPQDFAVLQDGWFWVTFASLGWFIGLQMWSMARDWDDSGGDSPPHLALIAKGIATFHRLILREDAERWRARHPDEKPPPERWTEREPEKVNALIGEAARRAAEEPPFSPPETLDEEER